MKNKNLLQQLDRIPWEMTPILMRHPVSRVPSLHFVHALYKHHESSIVDGNRSDLFLRLFYC